MAGYLGNIPVPEATQKRDRFEAVEGQTLFTTSGYSLGFIDVYLNGVKLDVADFSAGNGNDIVLTAGATAGDVLETVAFSTFNLVDVYKKSELYTQAEVDALIADAGSTLTATVDPTITANPNKAGTLWANLTSGALFLCIDNTPNANIWVNQLDGSLIDPNVLPSDPTNTGSFPTSANSNAVISFTFSGSTDPDADGQIVSYVVDNISTTSLTVANAVVAAGSAHEFTVAAIPADIPNSSFRVRALDNEGGYSPGVTVYINLISAAFVTATGGTVTTSGDYKIHKFTSSGTFTVTDPGNAAGNNQIEYLVVAAGGGGGRYDVGNNYGGGGGGGAGGYLASTMLCPAVGSYSVTVGGGGGQSAKGGNSVFHTVTAIGGGAGGSATGGAGGSGGGGAGTSGGYGGGGAGTSGQGYAGAAGNTTAYGTSGGGGGGATAAGTRNSGGNNDYNFYPPGGAGATNAITGVAVKYAEGGDGCNGYSSNASGGGAGGANTGWGGNGAEYTTGGSGGSGIVVIKYKFQ